ncbi:MAG TPA: exopolysaccharide biosynthesis protein [Opitutus sp.]|nr:exopolysaccharide biosynthesis protein [Opitutus sp.]
MAAPAAAPTLSGSNLTISPTSATKLSEDLALILREFEVETVTLREVMAVLHGRGYVLLVMLLALPFSTPIPLPGLSTPFGMVIALIGVRLALGQKPWLPQRLLDTRLSPRFFVRVFAAARKILRGFEYFLRPRLLWITGSPRLLQLHAVPIVLCSVLLLLPLPIPFSNMIPAFSILLLSAGLLERDGAFILTGYFGFVLSVLFFVVMGFAGVEGVEAIFRWFTG